MKILPIEARILSVVRAKQQEWKRSRQSPSYKNIGPKGGYLILDERYLRFRQDIINALGLKAKDEFHPEVFIFTTEHSLYQSSVPEAVGIQCELAEVKKGHRVFEIGTGLGEAAFVFAGFGASVTSVEINPYFFEIAKILQGVCSDLPGVASVKIYQRDYRTADLRGYDFYRTFLSDELLSEAYERITASAKCGAVIFAPSRAAIKPPSDIWQLSKKHLGYVKL